MTQGRGNNLITSQQILCYFLRRLVVAQERGDNILVVIQIQMCIQDFFKDILILHDRRVFHIFANNLITRFEVIF